VNRDVLFHIGNAEVRTDQVIVIVAAIIVMILLDQTVARTRIGRGIRATAQDPEAAVLMGVNIDTIVRLTFLLGGAMAGAAGLLYAMEFENVRYNIGSSWASRRSPRRSSAASATSAAPCWAGCCSAWWRTGVPSSSGPSGRT
jgi:branched-subunit amino acid ABC-type transport system permease component